MKGHFLATLLAWMVLIGESGESRAVLLSELTHSGVLSHGDLLFTEFEYIASGDSPPSASSISVVPFTDQDGGVGLRFAGPFVDLPGGSGSDSVISFTVLPIGPVTSLIGARLASNGEVNGGGGVVQVTETIMIHSDVLQLSNVYQRTPDPMGVGYIDESKLVDLKEFVPVRSVRVHKDVLLFATANSTATLSYVDQTFMPEPEPRTMSLGVIGAWVVWNIRRARLCALSTGPG